MEHVPTYLPHKVVHVMFVKRRRFCQRDSIAVKKVVIPNTRLIIASGVNPEPRGVGVTGGVTFCRGSVSLNITVRKHVSARNVRSLTRGYQVAFLLAEDLEARRSHLLGRKWHVSSGNSLEFILLQLLAYLDCYTITVYPIGRLMEAVPLFGRLTRRTQATRARE